MPKYSSGPKPTTEKGRQRKAARLAAREKNPRFNKDGTPINGEGYLPYRRNWGGRGVTPYKPEYVEQARKACENGATDFDLCQMFDVSRMTLFHWKCKYPEFAAAIQTAKEACDERVERAMYERATGYTYESEKILSTKDGVEIIPILEHVPPDVHAANLWLVNRRSDRWKNRQSHEGPDGGPVQIVITKTDERL